ncbi:hypothetical protein CDL12_10040 [Handroanthus impetiginosus]|uniref:Zinc knuckle CX2CX4HX4C domain-containing protein n=1 Tax=Handroanthus impetiginosus TaxID=429701 RepID=A0A2G9HIH1_9LAMI|nr:hypothetical protein CDL12_10040 [Handroanthus impetiginosus]
MEKTAEQLGCFLNLTEEEEKDIVVPWRIILTRFNSLVFIKSNFMCLLQPIKGVEVNSFVENRFLITFHHQLDLKHALEELTGNEDPFQIDLNMMPIVVQIHNVSYHCRNREVAEHIGNHLGDFIELLLSRKDSERHYTRIKIRIDVTKCLIRGINFGTEGISSVWLDIEYERLPIFFFLYGLIGHLEKKCPKCYEDDFEDPEENFEYGPWLSAGDTTITTLLH